MNWTQVDIVAKLLEQLYAFRTAEGDQVLPGDVMLISPYRAQRHLISSELAKRGIAYRDNLTIDAAQGQEAPIVIFLMTKPSDRPLSVGFVADKQRLNVALSRAQKVLLIVGNLGVWNRTTIADIRRATKRNKLLADLLEDVTLKAHTISWVDDRTVTETIAPPNVMYLVDGRTVARTRASATAARVSVAPRTANSAEVGGSLPSADPIQVDLGLPERPLNQRRSGNRADFDPMHVDSDPPARPLDRLRSRSRAPSVQYFDHRLPRRATSPRRTDYRSRSPFPESRPRHERESGSSRHWRDRSRSRMPPNSRRRSRSRDPRLSRSRDPPARRDGDSWHPERGRYYELEERELVRQLVWQRARADLLEYDLDRALRRLDVDRRAQDARDLREPASRRDRR